VGGDYLDLVHPNYVVHRVGTGHIRLGIRPDILSGIQNDIILRIPGASAST
jgi:hypothetical protein